MESKNQGKPLLPPMLTPPTKQERKRKSACEKAETEKRLDQARGQTRVNTGTASQRWSQLQVSVGFSNEVFNGEPSFGPPTF